MSGAVSVTLWILAMMAGWYLAMALASGAAFHRAVVKEWPDPAERTEMLRPWRSLFAAAVYTGLVWPAFLTFVWRHRRG